MTLMISCYQVKICPMYDILPDCESSGIFFWVRLLRARRHKSFCAPHASLPPLLSSAMPLQMNLKKLSGCRPLFQKQADESLATACVLTHLSTPTSSWCGCSLYSSYDYHGNCTAKKKIKNVGTGHDEFLRRRHPRPQRAIYTKNMTISNCKCIFEQNSDWSRWRNVQI